MMTCRANPFMSRQQALDPRPLDANELMRDMSNLLLRSIGPNIQLESVLARDLWRTFADGSQLESALINLCVNGRDAMPDGGRLILETSNIALDAAYARALDAPAGDYVCICVTDFGSGMTPEVLARAFEDDGAHVTQLLRCRDRAPEIGAQSLVERVAV